MACCRSSGAIVEKTQNDLPIVVGWLREWGFVLRTKRGWAGKGTRWSVQEEGDIIEKSTCEKQHTDWGGGGGGGGKHRWQGNTIQLWERKSQRSKRSVFFTNGMVLVRGATKNLARERNIAPGGLLASHTSRLMVDSCEGKLCSDACTMEMNVKV